MRKTFAICVLSVWIVASPGLFGQDIIDDTKTPSASALLYLKAGDPAGWTAAGISGSQSSEIQEWLATGHAVTTMNLDETLITDSLLSEYKLVRMVATYPSSRTITAKEGDAIAAWVNGGGRLFAEVGMDSGIQAVIPFGVEHLCHAPEVPDPHAPVELRKNGSAAEPFAVSEMVARSVCKTILSTGSGLITDMSLETQPAVVHGFFGEGRVVLIFADGWSADPDFRTTALETNLNEQDNLLFLQKVIQFVSDKEVSCSVSCTAEVPLVSLLSWSVDFQATGTTSNCSGSISYYWDFGDGTSSTQQNPSHHYKIPREYEWKVTVTADSVSCSQSGILTVYRIDGPSIAMVIRKGNPFHLDILGINFVNGSTVRVDRVPVPKTVFKGDAKLVAQGGTALKAMVPKNHLVKITVVTPDGEVSPGYDYIRW